MPDTNENLRISALVPAFNVSEYIEECLNSIKNQTTLPDEIIVIDDGSSDNTLQKIKEWAENTYIPTKIITQKNMGITKTRNKLMLNASYDLIAFLDSDDYWIDSHLEEMKLAFASNHELTCCFADAASFNERGILVGSYLSRSNIKNIKYREEGPLRILKTSVTKSLIPGCFIHLNSSVFRRITASKIGFFDESLALSEDRDFFIRLSKHGVWGYYPKVHSYIRQHLSNSTGEKNKIAVLEKSVEVARKTCKLHSIIENADEYDEAKRVLNLSLFNYRYSSSKLGLGSYIKSRKYHRFTKKFFWLLDLKSWGRALISSLAKEEKSK